MQFCCQTDGFISGLGVTWKQLESPEVLFGELACVLPSLEAKGVIIPDHIRAFADQAISENAIVDEIKAAKEVARKLLSIAGMGNQNAVGNGASKLGNTNGRGTKAALDPAPDQIRSETQMPQFTIGPTLVTAC